MKQILLRIFTLLVFAIPVKGQIHGVFVERYYVSDSLDATDTICGGLPVGSVTYRIYVDLDSGSKLLRIYGDASHLLEFRSTESFFNHFTDGQTFGKDISKSRYAENTVALDSWLTLGQVTRNAARTYFGVPKPMDTDGSFVGGSNNDGGSAAISGGLLTNADSTAGIPLTVADGNDTLSVAPTNWFSNGIIDPVTGDDSTVFGSLVQGNHFSSSNAFLANSGTVGKIPADNLVLVAQLTTTGDLSFKINIVVQQPSTPFPVEVKYVAQLAPGETNSDTLKVAPSLSYPPICGCLDPDYLEYSSAFSCAAPDSCRTLIVFGCMDTAACNYDPSANFNLPSLCCYPGYCNDRNLGVVCPDLNIGRAAFENLMIYPNPAAEEAFVQWTSGSGRTGVGSVLSMTGKLIRKFDIQGSTDGGRIRIGLTDVAPGAYILRLSDGITTMNRLLVKE